MYFNNKSISRLYNVVNLGIAGTSVQKRGPVNYWGMPQWKTVLPALSDVAIVIVQLGTNDAKLGVWNKTAFREDYILMLQNITDMHPHATIITSIPPPVSKEASEEGGGGYSYVNSELGTEITMATNTARLSRLSPLVNMQRVFKGHDSVALEDAATVGEQPKGLPSRLRRWMLPRQLPESLLQGDGVHVSQAGHNLMAHTFATLIVQTKSG